MIVESATPNDRQGILAVTANIDIFTEEEKDTVRELWDDRENGYHFLVARENGQVIGYSCFGERALTQGTYDLFWIAVDPSARRFGVGKTLMRASEAEIRACGGRLLVVETSGLEKYESTRRFYQAAGYEKEAIIRDFYRAGDDLVIYTLHF